MVPRSQETETSSGETAAVTSCMRVDIVLSGQTNEEERTALSGRLERVGRWDCLNIAHESRSIGGQTRVGWRRGRSLPVPPRSASTKKKLHARYMGPFKPGTNVQTVLQSRHPVRSSTHAISAESGRPLLPSVFRELQRDCQRTCARARRSLGFCFDHHTQKMLFFCFLVQTRASSLSSKTH